MFLLAVAVPMAAREAMGFKATNRNKQQANFLVPKSLSFETKLSAKSFQ